MTNSIQKGKRGEREVAKLLSDHGYWAERGQQRSGSPDSPDVKHDIEGVYIEVKFTEKFSVYAALTQAEKDCGEKDIPVVFHRRRHKPWVVVMDAHQWMDLVNKVYREGKLS